jgi:hypothetical protein
MSEDPCNPLKDYCPSDAVQERIAAIKAERKVKAAAEAEAFRLAIEKAKIEWEVEILMGLEDGKGPSVDILALPLEAWPEHDMAENVRQHQDKHHMERDKYSGMRVPCSLQHQPRLMRYISHSCAPGYAGCVTIRPSIYRQLVDKSTVLKDELSLAEALDAVQMGLESKVIDVCYDGILPLMKERAKFRLAFLRKIYPSLHKRALTKD